MTIGLPAFAGGSWIDPYRDSYEAGATVTMRGGVSAGQLGWIDDGPFFAYLRLDEDVECGQTFPCIHADDIPLGELELHTRADGWLDVSITFELPEDIADGEYWVHYCNDPCTEGLGDLIGGVVYVGITAEELHGPELEHEHATTSTIEITVESTDLRFAPSVHNVQVVADVDAVDASTTTSGAPWGVLGVGLLVLAVIGGLWARWRDAR